MNKPLALLFAAIALALVGCGSEPAPLPDKTANVPRPAPGTQTKDVMVPAAK